MNYIIFDLEWNQADKKSREVAKLPFEIIEIGAIKLNEKFEKIGEFSRLIRPTVYHTMHVVTRDIIHISMSELKHEQTFPAVCRHFLKWCGDDAMFGTWGPLDLTELQRNMDYYGFPALSEGPIPFLDVQKLYALCYEPEEYKKRRALNIAVEALGLEDDIPFHRAFGDAYYTAKVLQKIMESPSRKKLLKMTSYDLYHIPKSKEEEVNVVFDGYSKYISREFDSKAVALEDEEVMSARCYQCGRKTRKKIKWFTPNGKHFYYLGFCWRHGNLKGKIRIRKTEDEKVYVVKTLKLVSKSQALDIKEKQEKLREIRRNKRHTQSAEGDNE